VKDEGILANDDKVDSSKAMIGPTPSTSSDGAKMRINSPLISSSKLDAPLTDFQVFEVILDYLRLTNAIFRFKDFPKISFTDSWAFVNSSRMFLNRNAKDWYEFVDADEHDYLNNGLIRESSFDRAIERRTKKEQDEWQMEEGTIKQFVDPEVFKRFMIEMGIMKRCILAYDSLNNKKRFFRDSEGKNFDNPIYYFFIPSLTNASIAEANEYYSASENCGISDIVRKEFEGKRGHEVWFEWDDHSLTTVSLINMFLAQLFMEEKWNIELSTKANIYKEKLENRRSNVVSLIEFDRDLVLIEEENAAGTCFYTNRKIRIFVGSGILKKFELEKVDELRKIFKKSMLAAQNNITKFVHCEDGDIAFDDGTIQLEPKDGDSATVLEKEGPIESNANKDVNKDWQQVLEWMSPQNLARMGFGTMDPNFTTLAQCLGTDVFEAYQMYISVFPGVIDPPNMKLRKLLGIWSSTKTDDDNLVSVFIETLENGQKKSGVNNLNSLISQLKDMKF